MTSEAEIYRTGPRHVITEEKIKSALSLEKGNEAELLSWEVKDFSKKGDNMWSYVTSIQVKYSIHGEERGTSYIVKVAPDSEVSGYDCFMLSMFTQEETFYMRIALEMNSTLASAGLPCLNVAKGFYCSNKRGQEIILMEDLRLRDFTPFGSTNLMDDAHTSLALKSLAKFHASSILVMKKHPDEDLTSWYKYPSDIDVEKQTGFVNTLNQLGLEGILALARHVPGYEKAAGWLERARGSLATVFDSKSEKSSPFYALCHGDLNANNLLFRYDESGKPLEMMFVDLQGNMFSPLTWDLNFFFFMTLVRSIKSQDRTSMLTTYYNEFRTVIEAGGEVVPFTLQELIDEVRNKQSYGLYIFMIIVPFLADPELRSSETFFGPKTKEQVDEFVQKLLMMHDNYPESVRIIFDVLDDMAGAGVFD